MKTSQIFTFPKSANEAKFPMCLSVRSCLFVASVNLERESNLIYIKKQLQFGNKYIL